MVNVALVLLALAVVVLVLAQMNLYRLVADGRATQTLDDWPLGRLAAGNRLPVIRQLGDRWTGLVVVAMDDGDHFAPTMSALTIASERASSFAVALVSSGEPSGWERRLPVDAIESLPAVSVSDAEAFQASAMPFVVAVKDGTVVDATADLRSPSTVANALGRILPAIANSVKPSVALHAAHE